MLTIASLLLLNATEKVYGFVGKLHTATAMRESSDYVVSTYFAGFHAKRGFPVSAMPWEKYTDVKYAFA